MDKVSSSFLFFINSDVGGAERMSVLISKMLIKAGSSVAYVIIKNKENAASITDFLPKGHQEIIVVARNHSDKIKQFYKAIKKVKPDAVFSSHYSINDKVLLLRPMFGKVRFVIRSDNYFYTFSRMGKLIIRFTYRFADAMIAQTQEMKDEFVRHKILSENKIIVLENPVDKETIDAKLLNAVSPYPKDGKKHIVAVGRFAHQKGYDLLVEAFAQVKAKRDDCELYIVGAYTEKWKPEYDKVVKMAGQLGISDSIHFAGYQDNPYRYVKYADCFVLSSRWEGLPNVLAEALYLKTPIASFKCIPIIERMVRDGVDGYLAEKEDVTSLAQAMIMAVDLDRTNPIYIGAKEEEFVKLFR